MADDPVLAELRALIDRYGWAVRHVVPRAGDSSTPFSYTVGLTAMGHPEIVEQGLPRDSAQAFLNLVGGEVHSGRRFDSPIVVSDLTHDGSPIAFIRAVETSGLTAAHEVYGAVEAMQLVWSDSAGRLPWEADFGPGAEAQPLLGDRLPS